MTGPPLLTREPYPHSHLVPAGNVGRSGHQNDRSRAVNGHDLSSINCAIQITNYVSIFIWCVILIKFYNKIIHYTNKVTQCHCQGSDLPYVFSCSKYMQIIIQEKFVIARKT
ncbi:unnamed protein product [Coffea canephora]|uniref:Uncharacterized protein n=1 Tax=Coffea canephora TaxID=49390 RepID=A0A068TNF7_COFCA|nr:unnamed protein product [Coffea canephora]